MKNEENCLLDSDDVLVCIMTISGVLAIIHAPSMMKSLAHLGVSSLLSNLLGVSKLVSLCPPCGLVKFRMGLCRIWITILSACYSHFLSGDGLWQRLSR